MLGKKVLIIEDDVFIRKSIEETFLRAGAVTRSAPDGREGLRHFYQFQPDLVTLDLMMPQTDGWETCRQIRNLSDTPIIVLTAIKDENAEIRALNMGAIDFVTKPFRPRVLLARANAALRQIPQPESRMQASYVDDYLSVDLETRRVQVRGQSVKLTKIEFEFLAFLVSNTGMVLSHETILEKVWGIGYELSTDYVHTYMSRLRKKIEQNPRQPVYLLTERGVGYRFEGMD